MNNRSITLTLAALALSSSVNAVTLTFDDVPGSKNRLYGNMPVYQGFKFSATLDWVNAASPSFLVGAYSGDNALINNNGSFGVITEAGNTDFIFDGLWAKKWSTPANSGGADSLSGFLSGYNNGSLVWEVATGLNGSYEYYGPQLGAIDELRLGFGNYFVVDDVVLSTVVPVPAAVWLFGSGLIALTCLARRKA